MEQQQDVLSQRIDELAGLSGVLPGYWDIFGTWHAIGYETKKAILAAMKLRVDSISAIEEEIHAIKTRRWKSLLEPVYVISEHEQPLSFAVSVPVSTGGEGRLSVTCLVEDEKGAQYEFTQSGEELPIAEELVLEGQRYIRVTMTDAVKRDIGYYALTVTVRNCGQGAGLLQKKTRLIIAPETCYLPEQLDRPKMWGLAVNLYALRSERNWGVGDLGDLTELCRHVATLGGSFAGVNPLHAIPNTKAGGTSPYSPISRLYRNVIYLDVEAVADVTESARACSALREEAFRADLVELREARTVDYGRCAALKLRILRYAFDHFHEHHYLRSTERGKDFLAYLAEEGEPLRSFGLYLELRQHFIETTDVYAWQEWPESYWDAEGDGARRHGDDHEKEILFHCYVQWLLDRQLAEVQGRCCGFGMKVGLYHDLAIGSIGGGSDIWRHQGIAGGADVGAPPDDFNPHGQNWGFPALIPEKLRETGYELFIETLRKNMQHGGALRIDHALGLFRLFWIPSGMSPKEGGYVLQPTLDLLSIIALESRRNRVIVIAEDLGTIDDHFRHLLQQFRMLSFRLFYFEKNYAEPSFTPPEQYPPTALCAVTTHDLPTLYGYWQGHDIEVKSRLGIYADEHARQLDRAARQRDRGLILLALRAKNLIPDDFPIDPDMVPDMTARLCSAIYRYLSMTSCRLVLVSLDDIIGTLDQQNLPGTVEEHPNWVLKTPLTIEAIVRDPRFLDLKEVFSGFSGP